MQQSSVRLSQQGRALLTALEAYGALRLNSTPGFPNVVDLGGGWPEIMELVTAHLCFVSLLVDGRTTYLSLPVFAACAALAPERPWADEFTARLHSLLDGNPLSVDEMSLFMQASPKAVRQRLSVLQSRLSVTVFGPGRSLNPNWDTYVWCTRNDWMKACPAEIELPDTQTARTKLQECLAPHMSLSRASRLIDRLSTPD